jgi:hypothetical protein
MGTNYSHIRTVVFGALTNDDESIRSIVQAAHSAGALPTPQWPRPRALGGAPRGWRRASLLRRVVCHHRHQREGEGKAESERSSRAAHRFVPFNKPATGPGVRTLRCPGFVSSRWHNLLLLAFD